MKFLRLMLLGTASFSSAAAAQNIVSTPTPDQPPVVVAGSATFSTDGTGTVRTITQTTERAFLDWTTLNVPQNHTLRFSQPDANAITLNRVTGGSTSVIDGLIEANGQVWLLNPNGVFISPTGQVTTSGFLASTGNIAHTDFMNATTQFTIVTNGSSASIINQGAITTSLGYTVLHAAAVQNSGQIAANGGTVLLASVDNMSLSFDQGRLISYDLSNNSGLSANLRDISNTGTISANGGLVALSMASALGAISGVINVEGLIEANSVQSANGKVVLNAGPNAALAIKGTVTVEGTATGEVGGVIEASGSFVTVEPQAVLNADGKAGGGQISITATPAAQASIDFSSFQTLNPSVATAIQSLLQQREELNNGSLASVAIRQGSRLSASARESGAGGFISVNANGELGLATKVAGQLRANGAGLAGQGGTIDLAGFYLDIEGATLEAIGDSASLAAPGTVKLTAAAIDLVEQLTPTGSDVLAWQSSASLPLYNPADLQSLDLGDDEMSQRIPLGFSFLYFGETYDSVEVSSNGFVSFGNLSGNSLCCNGVPLDGLRAPPTIFGLWTDLAPHYDITNPQSPVFPTGNPRFATITLPDGKREFVAQWSAVSEFFNGQLNTFEIRIRENGEILLNYNGLSIVQHSVTAGLIGRTVNDTSQLFYRSFGNNFQNSTNVVSDFSQTSSIFRLPSATSQIRNQSIANILNAGSNLAINTKDFTTANRTNASIGNFKLTTPSALDFSPNGPLRRITVSADKNIRIDGDQVFSGPVEIRLVADANMDDVGGTVRAGNILDASLIDITGDLILTGLREIRALGDIVVRGDIVTAPESASSQLILDAQGELTVSSTIGDASLTFAELRAHDLDVQAISAGQINIDLSGTGVVTGPITSPSLSKFGSGNLSLTGANSALGGLRIAGGKVIVPDVANIGTGTLQFANGELNFTSSSAITLNNSIIMEQSGGISFVGSGTIAGSINSLSDGIGQLGVKSGGDLTFAGEIGTSQRLNGIFGTAEGRIFLGVDARLVASDVIQLIGFDGITNLSARADVLTSDEWFIWSGNPDPFGGSTPDQIGALEHDWRFYGISEAMVRGDALSPERPAGANGLGYAFAPVLTPQLGSSLSKIYDGTRDFLTTSVNLSFDGLVNGDTLSTVSVASILADVAGVSASQATISGINANFTDTSRKPVFGYQFSPTMTVSASILPRPLLVSLIGAVSRDYDGTTNALLTSGNFGLDGLVSGETITVTQTAGAFASPNVGNNLAISAILASTDFTAGTGTALSNYLLPTNASGAIGSILPLTLVYSANPAVRFQGAPNPTFTGSVTGFLQGETVASATIGTLIFTSPATIESDLGLYPIIGSGLSAINYVFVQAPENAKALTIQPNIINQVSNVNAQPQGSGTGTSGGSSGSGAASGSGSGSGAESDAGSESGSDADDSSSSSDSSETSEGGASSDSSGGSNSAEASSGGSSTADSGGSEAGGNNDDSASTDQSSSQQSSSTVVAVEVEPADPLPPSPVGEDPTPTPSDPEDSSDPVLAAISDEENAEVQTNNVQQQVVELTPSISLSPQPQARPSTRSNDNALSINVSLSP